MPMSFLDMHDREDCPVFFSLFGMDGWETFLLMQAVPRFGTLLFANSSKFLELFTDPHFNDLFRDPPFQSSLSFLFSSASKKLLSPSPDLLNLNDLLRKQGKQRTFAMSTSFLQT